jgi:hypothetical protein
MMALLNEVGLEKNRPRSLWGNEEFVEALIKLRPLVWREWTSRIGRD